MRKSKKQKSAALSAPPTPPLICLLLPATGYSRARGMRLDCSSRLQQFDLHQVECLTQRPLVAARLEQLFRQVAVTVSLVSLPA